MFMPVSPSYSNEDLMYYILVASETVCHWLVYDSYDRGIYCYKKVNFPIFFSILYFLKFEIVFSKF